MDEIKDISDCALSVICISFAKVVINTLWSYIKGISLVTIGIMATQPLSCHQHIIKTYVFRPSDSTTEFPNRLFIIGEGILAISYLAVLSKLRR